MLTRDVFQARRHDTALKWMHILAEEFSRQASMETDLDITSSLMSPPKKDMVSLSKAQLGFMNMFAIPLFQGVADIMPTMKYCVDELDTNKELFESGIKLEQAKQDPMPKLQRDGTLSPRTTSFAATPKTDKDSSTTVKSLELPRSSGDIKPCGFSPQATDPTSKPSHLPALNDEYKEMNGVTSSFDSASDYPFEVPGGRQYPPGKQRCSEATDGSASAPGGGDWASQATSATTGKMPLSPSTQGTSIISRDSLDRPSSVPVTTITAPDSSKSQSDTQIELQSSLEDESSISSNGNGKLVPEEKVVKKKSSRFRMNLNFLKRHKGTSPPLPAADKPH